SSGRTSSTPSSRSSSPVSDLPAVVDVAWLREHLADPDVVVGDVRGPNAHTRGHIPGSRPLVLGSPPPMSDEETVRALASEVGLRLRRHGITGEERLVLYDRGDGIGAMPTRDELARRLDDPSLVLLDVRTPEEFSGRGGYPCDPRQGHIPGARRVDMAELFAGPGQPRPPEAVRAVVAAPEGAEVVAYCHSGSRSALANLALRAAGYRARNYAGSWHEWSRHPELPAER